MVVQGIGEGTQVFGTLDAGELAPGFLGDGGGVDGGDGLIGGGGADMANQGFIGRVVDGDQGVAGGFDELTVKEIALELHVVCPTLLFCE